MRLLVTGAAGFIGSHFARLALRDPRVEKLVIFDALTYAGNLSTIADILRDSRATFRAGRIEDPVAVRGTLAAERITHVVNFAAESHNDRSMLGTAAFLASNAAGVAVLLDAVRDLKLERMVHVSTDEVYGSIESGEFTEESPLEPNTPYSASKAAGDLQCRAHRKAYGTPVLVTRGGNTYGPFQFPEKLIPFFSTRLLKDKKVPIYGDGRLTREWIHAEDHANGIWHVLQQGVDGEIYNIGDENERTNLEVVEILLHETGRDSESVVSVPDPRGGAHDTRYSMRTDKVRALGWAPQRDFTKELAETVRWYRDNRDWWSPLVETEDFKAFVKRYYGPALGPLL